MLCRYRGCGIRGVLRGKRRLPTLRKPRRTPSEGRERSSAFPREVCAFDLLCFFAHGGFQFPRDISRPDKRRHPNEQLSRTARTRARRFAARAIGRLAPSGGFAALSCSRLRRSQGVRLSKQKNCRSPCCSSLFLLDFTLQSRLRGFRG